MTLLQRKQFRNLHEEYKDVFDGRTLGGYNEASGPFVGYHQHGSNITSPEER